MKSSSRPRLSRIVVGLSIIATVTLVSWSPLVADDKAASHDDSHTSDRSLSSMPPASLPVASAAGDVIGQVSTLAGGNAPFGVTIDTDLDVVYTTDLASGISQSYSLDLTPGAQIPAPVATGTAARGIAYVPATQSLFWVDSSALMLHRTDTAGTLLDSFPFASPAAGGSLGGLAYDSASATLWADDIVNDTYFEFDLSGVPTGRSFVNPDAQPPLIGAYGNGIAYVESTGLFDIPTGQLSQGQTSTCYLTDVIGSVLDAASFAGVPDTFINGVTWHATGSTGVEVLYVVGNATDTLFEVEMTLAGASCGHMQISDFQCQRGTAQVELSWIDNDNYDAVEVWKNDIQIATLPGTATSYSDTELTFGITEYELRSVVAGASCGGGRCVTTIGVGEYPGAGALGITIAEDDELVIVVDLSDGNAYEFDRDLNFLGTLPCPGGAVTHRGICWNPQDNTLYWIDSADNVLFQTDIAGGILNSYSFVPPGGGSFGGLALNCTGDGLIVDDIVNDAYYEYTFDGTPTGFSFDNPAATPTAGAYGNGIAVTVGGTGYDIGIGALAAGGTDRLTIVDCEGNPLGCEELIGPGQPVSDSFVNGLTRTAVGPTGSSGEFRYVVGNAADLIFAVPAICIPMGTPTGEMFSRGDANGDGAFDISDPVFTLAALFVPGAPGPGCLDAGDANDDEVFDISDPVFALAALFVPGAPPPPAPHPDCGTDPAGDLLDCVSYPLCP